jgi:hypothetical protein
MADLKAALEDLEEGLRSGTQAERRLHRRWIGAAVLPALLIAGLIAWRASRAPAGTEPLQAVPLTTQPGVQRYPSFSPDGDHVVFTWTGPKQDNTDIYRQQIGAGSPSRLTTDPGNHYNPVWSPDGRAIAFLRGEPARSEVLCLERLLRVCTLGLNDPVTCSNLQALFQEFGSRRAKKSRPLDLSSALDLTHD